MSSIRSNIVRKIIKSVMSRQNIRHLTPHQRRANMEDMAKWTRMPQGVSVEQASIDNMYAEWICAPEASKDKAILYLHGGGFCAGSANTHRALAGAISKAVGAKVILPEYRLCPEHVFPAPLEDALLAYRWLLKQGLKNNRIIIAGDCAGGGLAVAAAIALRDEGELLPAGIVCISPWADLASTGESYVKRAKEDPMLTPVTVKRDALLYTGRESLKNPLVSPVYGDFKGLPPIFIQVGSQEIIYDDAAALARRAQSAGVEVTLRAWQDMWHVWHIFEKYMPESRRAIEEIGVYARQYYVRSMQERDIRD